MALSKTMFNFNPHEISDPSKAARELGLALIDTMNVETPADAHVLSKLWALLSAYKIGAIEGDTFLLELRRAFPMGPGTGR
jgi:hypothetical protein